MGHYHVGISGWRYAGWRKKFYPPGLTQDRELEYASRVLGTIEINGSFYSLQSPESWEKWYRTAPEGFIFSVKGPRYITHRRRLKEVEQPVATFFGSGVLALREKLGPILWQLPPSFRFDPERIEKFLKILPMTIRAAAELARKRADRSKLRGGLHVPPVARAADRPLRHALEVRHASFEDPRFEALLRKYRVARVTADAAANWPYFEEPTTDFAYARLHGGRALYSSRYDPRELQKWATLARKWRRKTHGDVYVYFDNDAKVHAPFDAQELAQRLPGRR